MTLLADPNLEDYAVAKSEPTDKLLRDLADQTYAEIERPQMLAGPIEGRFLKIVAMLIGARRALEIGTFTGYSALSIAEGLPDDGELYTCDMDPKVIAVARSYFARSPHGKKIHIMEGLALDSIKKLQGPFDFCFIDADKENNTNYYEAVFPLIRSGGVIVVDNVLWSGRVLKPERESDRGVCELNDLIAKDDRVNRVMLPIRDGVFLIRKK